MGNQVTLEKSDRKVSTQLKVAMQHAQTLGELYALMEKYSYEEFMYIYKHLSPEQQAKLDAIEKRDSYIQLLAIAC